MLATGGEAFLWPGEMNMSHAQLAMLDLMAAAALLTAAVLGVTAAVLWHCCCRGGRLRRGKPSEAKKSV